MPKSSVPDGELYDLILDEIDLGQLVDVIKMSEPFAEFVFRGFRPKASSLRSPMVRQRLLGEVQADDNLKMVLLEMWQHSHLELQVLIGSETIESLKGLLELYAGRYGGVNVFLALTLDERRGAQALAKSMSADVVRLRAGPGQFDEQVPEREDDVPEDRGDRELEETRERLAHAKKDKRELEQQLSSERGRVSALEKNEQKLRKEADRTRQERDEARKRADSSETLVRTLTAELAGLRKKLQDHEETAASLRRALDEAGEKQPAVRALSHVAWQDAVEAMMADGLRSSALDFLLAMAAQRPDDPGPHILLERLYGESDESEARRKELLWLAAHAMSEGDHRQAAVCACRAVVIDGQVPALGHVFWEVVRKTDLKDERRKSNLRVALMEVRQSSEELHERLMEAMAKHSRALADDLRHVARVAETERLFDIRHSGSQRVVSPRQIAEAVDRNQVEQIQWLRAALKEMHSRDAATAESVIAAVRELDPGAAGVLLSVNTMPAVVDGSNVAHHARGPDGKPRLRNLTLIRRELRSKGFFPVYLCADDALRCQIDHQSEFLAMLERGEVELADAKTDADGMIVEMARQLDCAMVTNDRMRDWDPEGTVRRIRYRIDGDTIDIWEQTA